MDSKDPKQVAIVTGSNTGIGRETALSLAKDGMKVFMACRSADRGHAAASYIREACPGADVEVLLLDLGTLESVRKCANDFKSRNLPLKLLINNAGVYSFTPWYTAEGVGGNTQVNHLGHYLLTRLLEDSLVAGAPSRVVNVSSVRSRVLKFPDPEKFFRDFKSGDYSHCKLANILFTFELQRRWQGKGIQACAVDPGQLLTSPLNSVIFVMPVRLRTVYPIYSFGERIIPKIVFDIGAIFSDIFRSSIVSLPPMSWFLKVAFAPTWDGAIPVYHAATTPLKTDHDKTPFRLFARGGFAWWGVTRPNSTPMALLTSFTAATLDWPVRYLSKGAFFSKVVLVPACPQAYDEDLASKLWSLSADAAGLSE